MEFILQPRCKGTFHGCLKQGSRGEAYEVAQTGLFYQKLRWKRAGGIRKPGEEPSQLSGQEAWMRAAAVMGMEESGRTLEQLGCDE